MLEQEVALVWTLLVNQQVVQVVSDGSPAANRTHHLILVLEGAA